MRTPSLREKRARHTLERALLVGIAAALAAALVTVPPPAQRAARPAEAAARQAAGSQVAAPPGGVTPTGGRTLIAPWSVDLTLAPAWELTLVPGIGRARARAILSLRERDDGPGLVRLDDLLTIRGIGPALLKRLKSEALPVRILIDGQPVREGLAQPSGASAPGQSSLPTMGP